MNEQELDALRALEQAATPGTWYNDDDTGVHTTYRGEKDRVFGYGYGNQGFICDLADGEYHEYYDANEQRANTEFIAAARNAMPVLLDEIDRLTAENTNLREWFKTIIGVHMDYDGYNTNDADQMRGLADEYSDMAIQALRGDKPYLSVQELDESMALYTRNEKEKQIIAAGLERVTRERDAAVKDLTGICRGLCAGDKLRNGWSDPAIDLCGSQDCENCLCGELWKWRGAEEGDEVRTMSNLQGSFVKNPPGYCALHKFCLSMRNIKRKMIEVMEGNTNA